MSQWTNQAEKTKSEWQGQANWKDQGAWIWVKWKAGCPKDAWKSWENTSFDVKHGWNTTGDWDCCLWIRATSPEEAEQVIQAVKKNQWVSDVQTQWAYQWA